MKDWAVNPDSHSINTVLLLSAFTDSLIYWKI
jgi:hypothetical protein